jgi:hypothetical protein
MGGYGSTRWGHSRRCTVEDALRLSVRDLRSYVGDPPSQGIVWNWSSDGRCLAQVGLRLGPERVDVSEEDHHHLLRRSLAISYEVGRSDGGEPIERVNQGAELLGLPMRFGGVRWWLVCPRCHRFGAALYLPTVTGSRRWGCRRCYGLRYLTQRLEPVTRFQVRMQRVAKRICGKWWEHWFDFPPPKPKWMRYPTYSRHVEAWKRADEARDGMSLAGMQALLARFQRYDNREEKRTRR